MKALDLFIRDCVENFRPSHLKSTIHLKHLANDTEEDKFIVRGIERIISNRDSKVAVLVRAGWQGDSIAEILNKRGFCILMLYSEKLIQNIYLFIMSH
ncbi:hypothetical protein M5E84_13140 [[Ruminococcus] torques]|nr:hypothetical protein M5E84_13140 [[Ruminococcus] torques]